MAQEKDTPGKTRISDEDWTLYVEGLLREARRKGPVKNPEK